MDGREMNREAAASRVGFWSGVSAAAAALAFSVAAGLGLLHTLTPPWDVVLTLVPSIALAPALLALFVMMHSLASAEAKPWTRLAVAFAAVYVPLCTTAYVVELSVVEPLVLSGQADRVALLTLTRGGWGGGVLNAVDGLGYVFLCLACFAAAPAFREGRRPERAIHVLLLANGGLVVPIALTYFVSQRFIVFTFPWALTLPALALALGFHLRRQGPASPRRILGLRPWHAARALVVVLGSLYALAVHPWMMNWGATRSETEATLPGDSIEPGPYFTRAISIDAPPSAVWPWIVQMGQDRGGFYSNTWLENLVTADIHNADSIHPEWQERAVGDSVPLARERLANLWGLARVGYVPIVALERERLIANIPGRFVLEPSGNGGTRLLIRESLPKQGPALTRWLAWDPIHFVMVQRMLRGIKERAEGRPLVSQGLLALSRAGWILTAATIGVGFFSRRAWWQWLALPAAVVVLIVATTGDWSAALAAFVAVGMTLLGTLTFRRRGWPLFVAIVATVLWVLVLTPDAFTMLGLLLGAIAVLAIIRRLHPTLRTEVPA